MIRFFALFGRKATEILSMFLLVATSTLLLAQNISPSIVAAPAETGQVVNEVQLPVFSSLHYADKENLVIKQVEKFLGGIFTPEKGSVRGYAISPDGKQIMYSLFVEGTSTSTYDLYYFRVDMKEPKNVGQIGSFDRNIMFPFQVQYWLDNSKVLLQAIDSGDGQLKGVILYNVSTFTWEKLPVSSRYLTTPIIYDNGTKFFYYVLGGNAPINLEEGLDGEELPYSYDLTEMRETQIREIPEEIQQKINNRQIHDPKGQNFLFSPESNSNGCYLAGSPVFNLPWPCNKAMCVERDGPQPCPGSDCNMSGHDMNVEFSDCPLLNQGSTYNQGCNQCPMQTCGHTKPAIDFGDGGLWFQTGTDVLASATGKAYRRNQASGAGDYVVMRHDKIGYPGSYVYTVYMHLSWVDPTIPWGPGVWSAATYQRGYKIGKEGKTGGQVSEHYHFELRDVDTESGTFYPTFSEYGGCTPHTGKTYISKNVPTDGSMQLGYDCSNVTTLLPCNTTVTGSTSGIASRYATYGNSYHNWDETGGERLYKITTTSVGKLTATLSNVTYSSGSDLDVFILKSPTGSCANLHPIEDCISTTSGLTATAWNVPVGTYYIIVEGSNGSAGSYTLNVSGPCTTNLTEYGSSINSTSGRAVNITTKIVNNENKNAGAFGTYFVFSNDQAFGNDYGFVTVNYPNGLSAGYYSAFTFTATAPTSVPAGIYYILFFIDHQNTVSEVNENDNKWCFNSQVTLPPLFGGEADDRSGDVLGIVEVNDDGSFILLDSLQGDMSKVVPIISKGAIQTSCTATVFGYNISTNNIQPESDYVLTNSQGQIICQGKASGSSIECSVNTSGIYFLTIIDGFGNRCSQKLMVK